MGWILEFSGWGWGARHNSKPKASTTTWTVGMALADNTTAHAGTMNRQDINGAFPLRRR